MYNALKSDNSDEALVASA